MKLPKQKIWFSVFAGIPISVAAPAVLISCSFGISNNSSLDKNEQLELINKNAKTFVLNDWLTSTFSTLYVDKIINNSKITDRKIRDQQIDEISYFLTNLKWKDQIVDSSKIIDENVQKKLEQTVYKAYKFFVTFRSSVSTGTEEIANPANFFVTKAVNWKKDKLTTIDGESLMEFNPKPGVLVTEEKLEDWKKDRNFSLLFKAWGTEVHAEVLKILMAQMYFLHTSEKEIKSGTDYNKQTRTKFNKNWLEATSFDVTDRFYFLNKYLITKNPQFKWEFKEENPSDYVQNIENSTDFNNLMGPSKKQLEMFLAPLTSDKITDKNSLDQLRGFTKLEYDAENTEGDLSANIDNLKTFGYEKSGLLNADNNNTLVSFSNLKAKQIVKSQNPTQSNKYGLPKIKIKENSLTKNIRQITLEHDIEMEFSNNGSTSYDSVNDTLSLSNSDQSWMITKLAFLPQETGEDTEQKINLSVKYKFKDNSKDYELLYNFDITWSIKDKTQTSPFDKEFHFEDDNPDLAKMFPSYINSQRDGKLDFAYILKPLPIFERRGNTPIEIDKQSYMTGTFSLENTIWSSTKPTSGGQTQVDDSAKETLISWFVLSDENLWKTIQDFYLFNDYNVEAKNGEFASVINELGLTKKTDQDRKNAGIKF